MPTTQLSAHTPKPEAMPSSGDAAEPASNLSHIYFFIDSTSNPQQDSTHSTHENESTSSNGSAAQRSRTSSPASLGTDAAAESVTSTSSSDLNPLAADFSPRASLHPPPTATQIFELRKTDNKGFGLFATADIPLGTLIVCEEPLLRITGEAVHSVWGAYCRLNNAQKLEFDKLHGHQAENLNFEQAARALVDPNDDSMDEDDIEEMVADQIRVMKIFSVNNFRLPPYDLGVFAKSSRLNHSCVPNVHHSYNPVLKRNTIFAVKDIKHDEELCITYLGGEGHYYVRAQRVEFLRSNYGFTCDCPACSDRTGASNRRREDMASIAWGLEQFKQGSKVNSPFIPRTRLDALKQEEDLVAVMLEEGIVTIELGKAYRTASMQALALKDYSRALEYARDEAMVEKNCMGTDLLDLQRKGVATACWYQEIFRTVRADLGEKGLHYYGLVKPKGGKKGNFKQTPQKATKGAKE